MCMISIDVTESGVESDEKRVMEGGVGDPEESSEERKG